MLGFDTQATTIGKKSKNVERSKKGSFLTFFLNFLNFSLFDMDFF